MTEACSFMKSEEYGGLGGGEYSLVKFYVYEGIDLCKQVFVCMLLCVG